MRNRPDRKTGAKTANGAGMAARQMREIFGAYAKRHSPGRWMAMSRQAIADRLKADHGLSHPAADYAADQILRIAKEDNEKHQD